MPFQACLLPVFEPFEFLTGTHEELHLHLFELAHAEDKLTGHNLVAESLANLCDAERYAHTSGFLNIEIVYKYALCCLRTEVYGHGTVGGRAHLSAEHEVELTYLGPVLGAGNRVDNLFVDDNLAECVEVVVVHGLGEAFVECVALGLVLKNAWIGLTE